MKRYNLSTSVEEGTPYIHNEGEWVKYADVKELIERVVVLKAALKKRDKTIKNRENYVRDLKRNWINRC